MNAPAGFVAVSKDEFFYLLASDPRDIMPCYVLPDRTSWKTKSDEVWGWTTPGWKYPGGPETYAVNAKAGGKA